MDTNQVLVILQVVANFLFFMTMLIYFLQWRVMRKQLSAMRDQLGIAREGVLAQNLFSLVDYLQDPEARDSRAWVLQQLEDKPFINWADRDRDHASRVCSRYDMVGLLVRQGVVPVDPVLGSWGPSIRKCHQILQPFISAMQDKHGAMYWDDFDWIFKKALEAQEALERNVSENV